MPTQERNSEMIAMMVSEFWHREDDIAQQAFRDVIPDADGRGLWRRIVNRNSGTGSPDLADGYQDHFRSGVIPAGFAWAGAPFAGAPAFITWAQSGSYLYVTADVGQQHFLYRTIGADGERYVACRMGGSANTTIGLRIDDGTDNNYMEALITPTTAARSWDHELKYRWRVGAGAVTTSGISGYLRSGELVSLYLLHSAEAQYILYMIPEYGGTLDGITPGVGGNFVASRIGLIYEGNGWPAVVDWLDWNFT